MKTKTAIIGGNGFIGSNLTKHLISKNIKVKVIDKFIDNSRLSSQGEKMPDVIQCDINNTQELINCIGDYENLVWLVHTSVPSNSMIDLTGDLMANLDPLVKLLAKIKDNPNIERFIFISSGGTIYGDPHEEIPIKEEHQINPISNYGITKYTQEKYINLLFKHSQIQTYILRPSNVYGPNQNLNKPQGIIGHAFKAAVQGHPISLFNHGQIVRDFLYVDDLSEGILLCLTTPFDKAKVDTYNIGSGTGITIKEIIQHIEQVSKQTIKLNLKPARVFDCTYNVLNCSKFNSTFNWNSHMPIVSGIQSVFNWLINTNR